MTFRVKLFGPQASLAGCREVSVDLHADRATAGELMAALAGASPAISDSIFTSRLAVNHEFVDEQRPVTPHDEIALIGMVSGG